MSAVLLLSGAGFIPSRRVLVPLLLLAVSRGTPSVVNGPRWYLGLGYVC